MEKIELDQSCTEGGCHATSLHVERPCWKSVLWGQGRPGPREIGCGRVSSFPTTVFSLLYFYFQREGAF